MTRRVAVVVLAAGKGVRMRSRVPKVLHAVAGRPMLGRVLETAGVLGDRVVVVVGSGHEKVSAFMKETMASAVLVVQDPPLGTGDALRTALPEIGDVDEVVVLSGDVPLLQADSVRRLRDARAEHHAAVALLTARLPEPGAYGRVVRDAKGDVRRVVEAKDASDAERAIGEVNAGVYAFDRDFLADSLPRLGTDNVAREYYLPDLLEMAASAGRSIVGIPVGDVSEILGVNTRVDLATIEGILRRRAAEGAMNSGATLLSPGTTTLDETVELSEDVVLEPFVTLLGKTRVGARTRVGQGTVITDSVLGEGVNVKPYCVIENARVGDGAIVGPFARLREGTELAEGVHVGNFVETKKARLEKGVKANHLTYLGDTSIGERTNVGAGVITCNYDGFAKHETTIGADVFVGSDAQLVAPVTVGDRAVIGAGTTVTEDVPDEALVTSRAPQKTVPGGGRSYRDRKNRPR